MPHHSHTQHSSEVTFLRPQAGGPGPRLRAAREALGLALGDIAKRMRLQEHVIHQIEQDIYDESTALVFIKGYLRSYAALVGLNPDHIIQEFVSIGLSEDRDAPDLSKLIKKSERPRRMNLPLALQSNPGIIWGCAAATVLAIVGLLWAYSGGMSFHQSKAAMVASSPAPAQAEVAQASPTNAVGPVMPQALQPIEAKLSAAKNAPNGTVPAAPATQRAETGTEPLLF